jgi:hypothetical protein
VEVELKYYRGAQFVPMKGTAAMFYETDDAGTVLRFMTVISSTGEIEGTDRPPVKKLFRPELLDSVEADEFEHYWNMRPESRQD